MLKLGKSFYDVLENWINKRKNTDASWKVASQRQPIESANANKSHRRANRNLSRHFPKQILHQNMLHQFQIRYFCYPTIGSVLVSLEKQNKNRRLIKHLLKKTLKVLDSLINKYPYLTNSFSEEIIQFLRELVSIKLGQTFTCNAPLQVDFIVTEIRYAFVENSTKFEKIRQEEMKRLIFMLFGWTS